MKDFGVRKTIQKDAVWSKSMHLDERGVSKIHFKIIQWKSSQIVPD